MGLSGIDGAILSCPTVIAGKFTPLRKLACEAEQPYARITTGLDTLVPSQESGMTAQTFSTRTPRALVSDRYPVDCDYDGAKLVIEICFCRGNAVASQLVVHL